MITFDNVTKIYKRGARPALDHVSLTIDRGEFVFLVGTSGSGKSTFLSLVLGEESATEGKILVLGKDLGRLSRWKVPGLRRQVGVVFQDFRLLENKNVYDNVAIALQVIGKPRRVSRRVVPEVLQMVGLGGKDKRFPHELSGGEQQRVAIARAMVNRPPILLADEPTGNLDTASSAEVLNLLRAAVDNFGQTVVMVTHDQHAATTGDRVLIVRDGMIVHDLHHPEPADIAKVA